MGRRFGRLVVLLVLIAGLAGAGAVGWGYWRFQAPGPAGEARVVVLPRGADLRTIARLLAEAGVITEPALFRIGVRLAGAGRRLKAGEYRFPARASPRTVMESLLAGRTVVRRLTVAEGLTSAQVAALLAAAEGLTGPTPTIEEGVILPETYAYSWGDSRAGLVARMRRALEATLDELWRERDAGLPFETAYEALILASIVEKETALADERPRIAGVFINRLRRGMRLQSDPTVAYGLAAEGRALDRPLTRADLKRWTAFNTYLNDGLPPYPIANPGRAAIAAVLRPMATKDLYFVADGTGGHAFAETLDEHLRNVRRWRRLRREGDG